MTGTKNKKLLLSVVNIAVWTCFLMIPFVFQQHPKDSSTPFTMSSHFRAVLISSSLFLIGFYYINTLFLIPNFLFTKKWLLYISSVLLLFIAFLYLPEWVASFFADPMNSESGNKFYEADRYRRHLSDSFPPPPHRPGFGRPRHHFHFFPGSYMIFILVFTISTCISLIQQWLKIEENKKAIERDKLNTELSFLKSQINPHFFFNTLNNIYSLAVTGSEHTASAILKLSSIMRYIISDTQVDFVPLENEVTFINHFIDLQLVRLTDKVSVDFTIDGNVDSKMIAPLIFICFVENAFKYGVSTKESSVITFHLNVSDKKIIFSSSNKIIKTENFSKEGTGIGISNVKRRLDLLYPNQHTLNIFDTEHTFSVKLEILSK